MRISVGARRAVEAATGRSSTQQDADDGQGVIEEDKHELDSEEESDVEKEVESVVRHLHLLAFSIRFGANSDDMSYYVLNALGSRYVGVAEFGLVDMPPANVIFAAAVRENDEESNLTVMPIFCMEQSLGRRRTLPQELSWCGHTQARSH